MTLPRSFARHMMKIAGARSAALDQARTRLIIVSGFFALAFIVMGARVVDLSLIQAGLPFRQDMAALEAASAPVTVGQQTAAIQVAPRGDIFDRNGVLLATSLETASLYADPALIPDPEAVAADLVAALPDLSYGEVLQRLQRRGRFVWIMRNMTPDEQFAVLNLGHPGLNFQSEYRRIYPQERLTAHLVGYANIDGEGLAGIERSFDSLLGAGGTALRLTLDVRLQHILRREIAQAVEGFSARAGAGVIMDVGSGEILASVSLPDFDPHDPHKDGLEPLFNRVTHGVYELGSSFKIFSTAALLELTDTKLGHRFDAREPLRLGRFTIRDFHPQKRELTVPEVFMHSSNIGSALMGEMIGTEAFKDFYRDLGLFDPLALEIGEIGRPLVPQPWRPVNTMTASYGHGIAVSPLQLVTAASAIAGGGTLITPHLILDETVARGGRRPGNDRAVRIVSPQTAHRMRQLMRLVVTEGTGSRASVPGYNVGGKSGTAEKPGPGGYQRGKLISSFIAFFPMEAPRYAVFVMVDEPKGTRETFGFATGGWVAAPVINRIIAGMAPLLGVVPSEDAQASDMAATLKQYIHQAGGEGL